MQLNFIIGQANVCVSVCVCNLPAIVFVRRTKVITGATTTKGEVAILLIKGHLSLSYSPELRRWSFVSNIHNTCTVLSSADQQVSK